MIPDALHMYNQRFVRQVEKTMETFDMLGPRRAVLIGVSGGADSLALLFSLYALAPVHGWRLGIAHVNHGLRGRQADAEQRFVASLASRMKLPYYSKKADVRARRQSAGVCLEEAGRIERYAFFNQVADAAGYDKIAVGHQKNDTAEQILMNLLRGTGPAGLGGIAPAPGRVIRPLIHSSRGQIEQFLRELHIPWCSDPSNRNERYTRNRIRNRLLPELAGYNPEIIETLNRLAEVMREESAWIDRLLEPVFQESILERNRKEGILVLSAKRLQQLPPAARRRIMRKAVCEVKGDLGRIGYRHVEAMTAAAGPSGRRRHLHLPGRVLLLREGGRIRLSREKKSLRSCALSGRNGKINSFWYHLDAVGPAGRSVRIDEIGLRMDFQCFRVDDMNKVSDRSAAVARVDFDKIGFPLVIRSPLPGDRFTPLGMNGKVKLKDFFINQKVPASRRSRIPVVQSPASIVWIGGMRIDEEVKITGGTTRVLEISLCGSVPDPLA